LPRLVNVAPDLYAATRGSGTRLASFDYGGVNAPTGEMQGQRQSGYACPNDGYLDAFAANEFGSRRFRGCGRLPDGLRLVPCGNAARR
jgi:hypothetical protein